MKLGGVFPALTTPYESEGRVSVSGMKENIHRYNATDLAGYVVLGSTGESVMLSRDEADAILAAVKEVADPNKVLIAGTGAESTAETIVRTKRAAEFGYRVALVKTPYYYKPFYRAEAYIQHYRAVADASPIPILLYSVPIFTGVTLEPAEILLLAAHPNIVGIKDSSGSIQRLGEVIANAPADFNVLTGAAPMLYPALTIGVKGGILALASALPEKCSALYDLHKHGQHEQAKQLQYVLINASRNLLSENGIAGIKYAMDLRGYHGGAPRLPLLPLKEANKQQIATTLAHIEPAAARV
jgi:4-hydroxy-2-oxoglutarate aldolase